jgi:hypothetical protein
MSDYNSQLPVRSKQDLDERLLVKLQDGDNPSGSDATATVTEKKLHVRVHSEDSDGNDLQPLLSQEGHVQSNGDYDATTNKRPSSQGLIASDRDASPSETTMNKRPTAVVGNDDKVALDVAISDSSGNRIDEDNPLPVYVTESPGEEIEDFDEAVDVATTASANHDYVVTALKEFRWLNIEASASGKAKFELQIETAASSGVFETKNVKFNSTANPNVEFKLLRGQSIQENVTIRLVKTNLDEQAQSIYSTFNGVEI